MLVSTVNVACSVYMRGSRKFSEGIGGLRKNFVFQKAYFQEFKFVNLINLMFLKKQGFCLVYYLI